MTRFVTFPGAIGDPHANGRQTWVDIDRYPSLHLVPEGGGLFLLYGATPGGDNLLAVFESQDAARAAIASLSEPSA